MNTRADAGDSFAGSLMSAPPTNVFSPEPVMTMARSSAFFDGLQAARAPAAPRHRLLDVAFLYFHAGEARHQFALRLSAYAPGVTVAISRNSCGFFEFWLAEELIELGREQTAQAFADIERLLQSAPGGAGVSGFGARCAGTKRCGPLAAAIPH